MNNNNNSWNNYAFLYDWEMDILYSNQKKDINIWKALANRYKGKILEIGTGSGRIAHQLNDLGFDIYALDNSSFLIKEFKRRYRNFPIENIFLGDMTNYEFPIKFDFVFYSYSTFQYLLTLEEQINALLHIRKFLNKNAKIAFDICPHTCDLVEHQQTYSVFKRWNSKIKKDVEFFSSHQVEPFSQITRWFDSYVLTNRDGSDREVVHHKLALKGIRIDTLNLLLDKCGFQLENIYGDFDLGEVTPDSDNLIFVATCK